MILLSGQYHLRTNLLLIQSSWRHSARGDWFRRRHWPSSLFRDRGRLKWGVMMFFMSRHSSTCWLSMEKGSLGISVWNLPIDNDGAVFRSSMAYTQPSVGVRDMYCLNFEIFPNAQTIADIVIRIRLWMLSQLSEVSAFLKISGIAMNRYISVTGWKGREKTLWLIKGVYRIRLWLGYVQRIFYALSKIMWPRLPQRYSLFIQLSFII